MERELLTCHSYKTKISREWGFTTALKESILSTSHFENTSQFSILITGLSTLLVLLKGISSLNAEAWSLQSTTKKKCLQTSWFCGFLFVTFSSVAVIWLPLGESAGSLGQSHWKTGNKKEVVWPIGNLWGNAEEESNLLSDRKSYRRQMSRKSMLGDVSEDAWGSCCLSASLDAYC